MAVLALTIVLSACTNEPNATIRDINKTDTQVTISLFIEDPSNMMTGFDVILKDGDSVLTTATNTKDGDSIEGVFDITFPMVAYDTGTYDIVVQARLKDDETIELLIDSIDWP